MLTEHEAWKLAKEHFSDEFRDWLCLERTDFGWMARVEEPPIGPGDTIGHPVLALGPEPDQTRFYPSMPPPRLVRAHQSWLSVRQRTFGDPGPPSFI